MLEVRRDPAYLSDTETSEYLNHLGYQLVSVSPSALARLRVLRDTRSDAERVCAAWWFHRRAHRARACGADRVGAGRRDGARNRPRHAAAHCAHAGEADVSLPRSRSARCCWRCSRRAQGVHRAATLRRRRSSATQAAMHSAAVELFARSRARSRPRRVSDIDRRRIRQPRHGRIFRHGCNRARASTKVPRLRTCAPTR